MTGTQHSRIRVDPAEVERFASLGMTQEQIAAAMGISDRTLYERKKSSAEIADAIKRGRARGLASVSEQLFKNAMSGNVTAQIFYLKAQGGWNDKQTVEIQQAQQSELEEADRQRQAEFQAYLRRLPTPVVDIITSLLYADSRPELLPPEDVLWEVACLWNDGRSSNPRYVLAEVHAGTDTNKPQLVQVTRTDCERRFSSRMVNKMINTKRAARDAAQV